MEMPDSPPQPSQTAKSTWDSIHGSLPVSYQVAIALDAFVLFITFAALLLLTIYIRKQIKRKRLAEDDLEMKCCGGSRSGSICTENTVLPGEKRKGLLAKLTGEGRKPKGHVRWTSSVEAVDEKGLEREVVKMKRGSGEWETDTWGPRSSSKAHSKIAFEENAKPEGVHHVEDVAFDIGMRGDGGASFRINPSGKGRKNAGGISSDGEWKRGSLWKGMSDKREKAARSKDRIAAGRDGFRGN